MEDAVSNIIKKDKAIKILRKPTLFFQQKRKIVHVELINLPYYHFLSNIIIKNDEDRETNICIDGISGEYAFVDKELSSKYKNNYKIPFKVELEEAGKIANSAVNQFIVTRMKQSVSLEEVQIKLINTFKYPYWMGLFKKGKEGVQFDVIDGVTGKKQGPKMKPVFIELLLHQHELKSQNRGVV